MLKYPEVVTNLYFIKVSTFPLEIWVGIRLDYDTDNEDDAYFISAVGYFCRFLDIYEYMLQTQNQPLILDYLRLSIISVNKITQFGLRPP